MLMDPNPHGMEWVQYLYNEDWLRTPDHPEALGLKSTATIDEVLEHLEGAGGSAWPIYGRALKKKAKLDPVDTQSLFPTYSLANAREIALPISPRLDSWMAKDHPDQVRLREYLASFEHEGRAAIDAHGGKELGLELVVATPEAAPAWPRGYDLDNYLLPVVRALGSKNFRTVSGRKQTGGPSQLRIGLTENAGRPDGDWRFAWAKLKAYWTTAAFKDELMMQIHEQVNPISDGPVHLRISIVTGRVIRNWATLWKPIIDSLEGLLGRDSNGRHTYQPRDDLVTCLTFDFAVSPSVGKAICVAIWWRQPTALT